MQALLVIVKTFQKHKTRATEQSPYIVSSPLRRMAASAAYAKLAATRRTAPIMIFQRSLNRMRPASESRQRFPVQREQTSPGLFGQRFVVDPRIGRAPAMRPAVHFD